MRTAEQFTGAKRCDPWSGPGRHRGVGTMRCVGRLAEMIAASAGALSRATGRGGGTSLPGMVLNKLEPGALARLGSTLGGGAAFISATNGKTTTARLLSACLRADGRDVTANAAGANLASGVTAALLARERRRRAEQRDGGRSIRGTGSRTSAGKRKQGHWEPRKHREP